MIYWPTSRGGLRHILRLFQTVELYRGQKI
jgi:hypothetical protein